ncbi:FAD-dependent oxidoreductase [Bacillus thuringiensis]|uniref:FAD-dependent oxidoreductase n=1 Tax=Bacillus thuringiensis TaxID=1428 RepID=UPI0021D68237|nr:FAD-dependent oxidoreductase [Bacillus thuringiensis]MCU7666868.1 FAD-dependent oxidoreductase [Bacillus thuringiensis]
MNKRILLMFSSFAAALIICIFYIMQNDSQPSESKKDIIQHKAYDMVIYGGGPQAVAAAIQASDVTNNKKEILMIVPEKELGSILTAGAQNLYDVRQYQSQNLPTGLTKSYPWAQGGSMNTFYTESSIVFSPEGLANIFKNHVEKQGNITVLYEHDIEKVFLDKQKKGIKSVIVYPLIKDEHDRYIYNKNQGMKIDAPVFVDASETGKLTYISGMFHGVVGREDINADNKQMVATLMFKLKGLDMEHVQKHQKEGAPFKFYFTNKGSLGILGGYEINSDPKFKSFNQQNEMFRLKPYNAGEDGYSGKNKQTNDTEMWMNMLLVYDVDARKMWRDNVMKNGHYPKDGGMDPEIAKEKAIEEIQSNEFISMIRKLPGLDKTELVLNKNGKPVVGDIMYLRESIHSMNEDGTFSLTKKDTLELGDEKHYKRRIGLGFYNFDSNTYKKGEALSEPRTVNPWYVPYDVLISTPTNLLIPGYAANMDSYTWRAMRVYPNLLVLGDAAGVAGGLYLDGKFNIHNPTEQQIKLLQEELEKRKVILNK